MSTSGYPDRPDHRPEGDPRPYQGPRSPGGPSDHEHPHGFHTSELPDRFASVTGASPARSALTLRLILAVFGLVFFIATAVLFWYAGLPTGTIVVALVFAAIALVDTVVVARRKHREH